MKELWEDKERIMRLAGMVESDEPRPVSDEEYDGRYDRERQVMAHVKNVCSQLHIPLDSDRLAVMYDEHPNNEVTMLLDDVVDGFSIRLLAGLYKSGMSDDYVIQPYDQGRMQITFIWKVV